MKTREEKRKEKMKKGRKSERKRKGIHSSTGKEENEGNVYAGKGGR